MTVTIQSKVNSKLERRFETKLLGSLSEEPRV
jgi:hypothetical protein